MLTFKSLTAKPNNRCVFLNPPDFIFSLFQIQSFSSGIKPPAEAPAAGAKSRRGRPRKTAPLPPAAGAEAPAAGAKSRRGRFQRDPKLDQEIEAAFSKRKTVFPPRPEDLEAMKIMKQRLLKKKKALEESPTMNWGGEILPKKFFFRRSALLIGPIKKYLSPRIKMPIPVPGDSPLRRPRGRPKKKPDPNRIPWGGRKMKLKVGRPPKHLYYPWYAEIRDELVELFDQASIWPTLYDPIMRNPKVYHSEPGDYNHTPGGFTTAFQATRRNFLKLFKLPSDLEPVLPPAARAEIYQDTYYRIRRRARPDLLVSPALTPERYEAGLLRKFAGRLRSNILLPYKIIYTNPKNKEPDILQEVRDQYDISVSEGLDYSFLKEFSDTMYELSQAPKFSTVQREIDRMLGYEYPTPLLSFPETFGRKSHFVRLRRPPGHDFPSTPVELFRRSILFQVYGSSKLFPLLPYSSDRLDFKRLGPFGPNSLLRPTLARPMEARVVHRRHPPIWWWKLLQWKPGGIENEPTLFPNTHTKLAIQPTREAKFRFLLPKSKGGYSPKPSLALKMSFTETLSRYRRAYYLIEGVNGWTVLHPASSSGHLKEFRKRRFVSIRTELPFRFNLHPSSRLQWYLSFKLYVLAARMPHWYGWPWMGYNSLFGPEDPRSRGFPIKEADLPYAVDTIPPNWNWKFRLR